MEASVVMSDPQSKLLVTITHAHRLAVIILLAGSRMNTVVVDVVDVDLICFCDLLSRQNIRVNFIFQ